MTAKKTPESVTIGVNPADLDLSKWVQGIKPNRASVPVYGRPDLASDIQDARRRLAALEAAEASSGKPVERGIDDPGPQHVKIELDDLTAQYEASRVMFVVEGRSTDRRNKIAKDLQERGVIGADLDDLSDEDNITLGLHQLCDAIVEPEGITVDLLRVLNEQMEPQLAAVAGASRQINVGVPQVSRDFSSRPSGSPRTRTS